MRTTAPDAPAALIEPWTCPSCLHAGSMAFCAACGERRLRPRDLSMRRLVEQVVQTVVSVDGRLLRTVRALMARPGSLTVAYLEGRRKPYVAPLQMFLLANVAFFALQSLPGTKVFATPLDTHLRRQPWDSVAQRLVARRLSARHTSLESYAPEFDRAVGLHAKSLVGVMVLPFAVMPALLFRRRRPFVGDVVFSLHFFAFVLFLFSIVLAVEGVDVARGGMGLRPAAVDQASSLLLVATCAAYLFGATGAVYGARGGVRIAKVAALTVAGAGLTLGYRFFLFVVTLSTT